MPPPGNKAGTRPPITITIYNPALLKKEDLIRGFIARHDLLDRLLEDVRRESPDKAPQHHLAIGQRGLGKTTLLRRLAFAVEDDQTLGAAWMPLIFPEEQYNVAGLADFWLNCVDALSDALDRRGDTASATALDGRVKNLPATGTRSANALKLLLDEATRLGRRLLLLVDNIDIVFDRIAKDEEWEFRRIISAEPRLLIVGSSSRALETFYEYGRPFYDFFRVHELKGFEEAEMFETLRQFAEQSGNQEVAKLLREQPARIRALRVLTGGNPRTLVILYKVLAAGPEGDVQRDIEQLLDEYTALYKARFEELSAQGQQVVDAMAIHWDPLTAADLTELLTPMTVNQVSAQLARLEDFGVVEKTPWFGEKKNAYQVAERFFNIWYLMRASRRARRRLLWLVKFLETWFGRDELDTRARALLDRDPDVVGRERYADLALAYSQTVTDRYLRCNLESAGLRAILDDGVDRLIDFSDSPPELLDKKARMEQLRELREQVLRLDINWGGIDPREFWRLLGGAPFLSLTEKTRVVNLLSNASLVASDTYETLRRIERLILTLAIATPQAVAQLLQAIASGEMADIYDYENAIAVAKRFDLGQLPLLGIRTKSGIWSHGNELAAQEIAKARNMCLRMTTEPGFEVWGWLGLGYIHEEGLADYAEAETAYRRAISLDSKCALPLVQLGNLLTARLDRVDEAEQCYRRAIDLDSWSASPWVGLGVALYLHSPETLFEAPLRLAMMEEAEQCFRRAIEIDQDCARALNYLGVTLAFGEPLRHKEAIEALKRGFDLDASDFTRGLLPLAFDRLVKTESEHAALLSLLQEANAAAPESLEIQFRLAQILTLSGQWPEASAILERLAATESANFHEGAFAAALKTGHLADTIAILERTGANERWRPLYEALCAAQAGTPDYLRTVAPEVRMVAEQILKKLDPALLK